MNAEKTTRLDQFEIREAVGVWPDFALVRKARRASAALFRFDTLCAGAAYTDHRGRELGQHVAWFNADGTPAEYGEGVPHLMREYLAPDPTRGWHFFGGNYRDCGQIRDARKTARAVCLALSDWFAAHGAPQVRAELAGDLRYIRITDGRGRYDLI